MHQPSTSREPEAYDVNVGLESDDVAKTYISYSKELTLALKRIQIPPPVKYVYAPVEYAGQPHEAFVRTYLDGPKEVLFVGMNPGPFGMCQTGVPFGDIKMTSDWLGITGVVTQPNIICPNRPIRGFEHTRKEVSGTKFWGLMEEIFGTPEQFFRNSFVHNYCSLAYMDEKGCNITPHELPKVERQRLEIVCDRILMKTIDLLNVRVIVAIGHYTETCVKRMLKRHRNTDITVKYMQHPSGRAPKKEPWANDARILLQDIGMMRAQ